MVLNKTDHGFIRPVPIEEEMRTSYLDYAMSVIVARALPDIRDGLKPVQRRILFAMRELGIRPNSSHKKSARLVGEVLGKYHPHGEGAVYDAMVRLAQPWVMRLPLVDGQGNFGSVDDDPPAAMRYTEARLALASEQILESLDQETVDFIDNFDASLQEPTVLPARLPNLLINGASGIAVGMATNIPPHNPSEICAAILKLIDNPDATVEDLMRNVKGPDFPTGGTIMGREGIRNAYTTGRGQIVVRAKTEIEAMERSSRDRIVVTELPYQVNKASLIEKIANLVKEKRIEGITELRDESDREGMRIVMELRGGAQPQVVLNNLHKLTPMQNSFSANMLAIVQGTPQVITLKLTLQHYIEFRKEIITRRSEYELRRAQERAHILEGLRIAINQLDEVIALIRGSKDAESARTDLMSRFGLDQSQAQAILDMQLRRIAALERERLEQEYTELQEKINGLQTLLGDSSKVLAEIRNETVELRKKLGEKRRTRVTDDAYDLSREELEPNEQIVVTISKGGYIKRISANVYRNQHRGGKGVTSMNTKEDDPVRHILVGDTHDTLLFFTNKGRVLSLTSYELRADTSRNTRGVPLVNIIALGAGEKVNAVICVEDLNQDDTFLVMATRKGSIKRTPLKAISKIRSSGLIIMNLKPGDELVAARLAKAEEEVFMASRKGMSIRFPVSEVTPHSRLAGGMKGMVLREDRVVSMDIVRPDSRILVISVLGYGKLTPIGKYRLQGRGGLGIKTFNITKKTGVVAAATVVGDTTELYVVSEQAQVLRTNLSEISSMGRLTQGVTIFKPQTGDKVSSIACVNLERWNQVAEPHPPRSANGKSDNQIPLDGMN